MLPSIYSKLDWINDTEEVIKMLMDKMKTITPVEFSKIPISNKQSCAYKVLQNNIEKIRIVDDTMLKKNSMWKYFNLWLDVNDVTSRVSINVGQRAGTPHITDEIWDNLDALFNGSINGLEFIPLYVSKTVWE